MEIKYVLSGLLAHNLSLEAAKILFAMHNGDQKLTPHEVAYKLHEYYTEAREILPEEGKPPFTPQQAEH